MGRRGSSSSSGPRDETITEESLKAASSQFDLTVVFKLSMARMGLPRVENLHLVPNLTDLDLSHNRIARMEGFEALEYLKRLVLADNAIERLEGLADCESLETLQLQGNRITNLDDVACLTPLPCLRHLALQSSGGAAAAALPADERNPMCEHPAYRTAVRRMCPHLQTLDGERTALVDAAGATQSAADAIAALSFPEPESWLANFDWGELGGGGGRRALGELSGAPEFDEKLTECKRLSAKAKSLIDDYTARTPRYD